MYKIYAAQRCHVFYRLIASIQKPLQCAQGARRTGGSIILIVMLIK